MHSTLLFILLNVAYTTGIAAVFFFLRRVWDDDGRRQRQRWWFEMRVTDSKDRIAGRANIESEPLQPVEPIAELIF